MQGGRTETEPAMTTMAYRCSHGQDIETCGQPHQMRDYLDAPEFAEAWPPNDPRWRTYRMGWISGYRAAHWDMREKLPPDMADEIVLERLAALLRHLRETTRANGRSG